VLNINEKVECNEEMDRSDKYEQEVQTAFEFYNPNYSVNYFGLGRAVEDWENNVQ